VRWPVVLLVVSVMVITIENTTLCHYWPLQQCCSRDIENISRTDESFSSVIAHTAFAHRLPSWPSTATCRIADCC
jgi:hypothetical protein